MSKNTFNFPFSRYFPKKVVRYLVKEIDAILLDKETSTSVSKTEYQLLETYKKGLLNNKIYYERASLDFAREVYPLVLRKEVSEQTQHLYSEVIRLNPNLVNGMIGYQLIFQALFGKQISNGKNPS